MKAEVASPKERAPADSAFAAFVSQINFAYVIVSSDYICYNSGTQLQITRLTPSNVSVEFMCGSTTSENGTYFVNPSSPERICNLMINRINDDICQVGTVQSFESFVFDLHGMDNALGTRH